MEKNIRKQTKKGKCGRISKKKVRSRKNGRKREKYILKGY
jgi:hypothetical protein